MWPSGEFQGPPEISALATEHVQEVTDLGGPQQPCVLDVGELDGCELDLIDGPLERVLTKRT